jgi:putative ABC transport system permease protein
MIGINLWIALKALTHNRLQALLTLCGMSVGIAMVVVVAGLGRGAQSSIEAQLEEAGPTVITLRAGNFVPAAIIPNGEQDSSGGEPGEASESALDVNVPTVRRHEPAGRPHQHRSPAPPLGEMERQLVASRISGVRAVAASVEGNARREGDGGSGVVRIHGIEAAWPAIKGWRVRAGALFTERDLAAAADVALVMPPAVQRLWPREATIVGRTVTVGGHTLRIVGVVDTVVGDTNVAVVPSIYVPLRTAQALLARQTLDSITVQTASVAETTAVAAAIKARLRELRRLPADTFDDFRVDTQTSSAFSGRGMDPRLARAVAGNIAGFEQASYEEIARSLRQAGRTMTLLLLGAATVSLVVGGIGVMNIMLVSVTSRTREIGLRMAMGARTADVLIQFLGEAVALASTGGVLGLALGIAGLVAARHGLRWATAVSPTMFFLALGMAALTGIAFGFGPARRAAALDPVVALRAE